MLPYLTCDTTRTKLGSLQSQTLTQGINVQRPPKSFKEKCFIMRNNSTCGHTYGIVILYLWKAWIFTHGACEMWYFSKITVIYRRISLYGMLLVEYLTLLSFVKNTKWKKKNKRKARLQLESFGTIHHPPILKQSNPYIVVENTWMWWSHMQSSSV